MSMNLTLHDGEVKVPLWQTPSLVTWMCLSTDESGAPDGGQEGVRRRYLLWVESQTDGVWESRADLEAMRASIFEHKQTVLAVRRPTFSYE